MLDERGIKIKEASCWFHMSCEKIGKVVEVLTQVEMKETMSVGSRGFKVLHTLSRAPILACITSDHVLNEETDVDTPNSTAACYPYIIYHCF